MAQRDELARSLRAHDSRHFGHRQHVAFGDRLFGDQIVRFAPTCAPAPSATAVRSLSGLSPTSTIRARPASSRWLNFTAPPPAPRPAPRAGAVDSRFPTPPLGPRLRAPSRGAGRRHRGRFMSAAGNGTSRRLPQARPRGFSQRVGQRIEHRRELAPRRVRRLLERTLEGGPLPGQHRLDEAAVAARYA